MLKILTGEAPMGRYGQKSANLTPKIGYLSAEVRFFPLKIFTRPHCGTLSVVNSPCAKTKKHQDCDDMVRMIKIYKNRKIIIMCKGKKDSTRIMNSESWEIFATLLVIFLKSLLQ